MKEKIVLFLILFVSITCSKAQDYVTDVRYDEKYIGISLGYVNQNFKYVTGDYSMTSGGIWENDKKLHGFTMGLVGQVPFDFGIGLYLGMNMEIYGSSNNSKHSHHAQTVDEAYDSYTEIAFNIPIHLYFKVPLDSDIALGLHTGIGSTITCMTLYEDTKGYYDSWTPNSEDSEFKNFNLTYDFALFMEIYCIRLDVQWDDGLINMVNLTDWDKIYRNKFTAKLSFMF